MMGDVERKAGKQKPADYVANSHRNLVPEPPLGQRDLRDDFIRLYVRPVVLQ